VSDRKLNRSTSPFGHGPGRVSGPLTLFAVFQLYQEEEKDFGGWQLKLMAPSSMRAGQWPACTLVHATELYIYRVQWCMHSTADIFLVRATANCRKVPTMFISKLQGLENGDRIILRVDLERGIIKL